MNPFAETMRRFSEAEGPRIAVFKPLGSKNKDLYPFLTEVLSAKGHVEIVDEVFVDSFAVISKGLVDLLIIPEMDCVTRDQFKFIRDYARRGGGLLLSAEDFFMRGKIVRDHFSQFDPTSEEEGEAFFQRSTAYLGIKPYQSDISPTWVRFDADFIPVAEGPVALPLSPMSAQFNNSSSIDVPAPPAGHVFPERYEVLRNYDAAVGTDPLGRRLSLPVCFAQNWETGSRYALIAFNGKGGFLDPENPYAKAVLEAAVDFCANRVFACDCVPEYACYRDGEAVKIGYTLQNGHEHLVEVMAELSILDGDAVCYHTASPVRLAPGETYHGEAFWLPASFAGDCYRVTLRISNNDRLLSKCENGFVVWKEEVATGGPEVKACGKYFLINGKPSVITGTNYYESNLGEMMWIRPNIAKLADDLRQMQDSGINYIRIHYHHAKWFLDYLKNVTGRVPDYYREIAENSCLPSERILRIFDAHIYLCQKFGIIYGGDLFTLIPEEMGDPRGWFGVQDYLWFPEKRRWQKAFLDLLIPRYIDVKGIAWDLYNEPHGVLIAEFIPDFSEAFLPWAKEMKAHLRKLGDNHLVTVGIDDPERFETVLDFYAEHRNYRYAGEIKCNTEKPEMFQEVWLDRPPTPEGDAEQRKDMRQALLDTFRTGLAGFSPWQWTNQIRLWADNASYIGEIWDDRLGCCVRNDGTVKPAGRFYRDFIWCLRDLAFLAPADGGIQTEQGILRIRAAGETEQGEAYFALERDGSVLRAAARRVLRGETLTAEADCDCDVWYFHAEDGTDFVRADEACALSLHMEKAPSRIGLAPAPGSTIEQKLSLPLTGNTLAVCLEPWQAHYWLRIEYKT